MTVSAIVRRSDPAFGDGSNVNFPFLFKSFNENEVAVFVLDPTTNVETKAVFGVDYTVTLNLDQEDDPGGTAVFAVAPDVGFTVVVAGEVPYDQQTALPDGGRYRAETVETALDRLAVQAQQLAEEVSRAAKVPVTTGDAAALSAAIAALSANLDNLIIATDNIADIIVVSDNIADVNTTAGSIADVNAVGQNIADVSAVADNEANVDLVAGSIANVNTVAGNTSNVNTVATNIASVNTVAGALNSGNGAALISYTPAGTGAVATNVQSKLREFVSVKDFGAIGDGVADDATAFANAKAEAASSNKSMIVPAGSYLNGKPSGVAGDNILWEYTDRSNSRNVLDAQGNRGGYFADYDCQAEKVLIAQFDEDQSAIHGGGFRETLFLNAVDNDTTNYTAVGQKIGGAIRGIVQGAYDTSVGVYVPQYKDLHGAYFAAIGDIRWNLRGCSGVLAEAVQYGSGIASNEFAATQPANAPLASVSMAAVQAIIDARRSDENAPTNVYRGVYVSNRGRRATFGVQILSDTTFGYNGQFATALGMRDAIVTNSAITMPQSASGSVGTIIEYDGNDFSYFDRASNFFGWVVGGAQSFTVGPNGAGVGLAVLASTQTRLQINSSTAGLSHLQLIPGATPSAPNNGEIWFDGTNVKIVVGGVVKTFTLV